VCKASLLKYYSSHPATHAVRFDRCNSSTCVICSRTCTAFTPSYPPTPALSYSPTPPATPILSPRRQVLSLHSANSNSVQNCPPTSNKRRKSLYEQEGYTDTDDVMGVPKLLDEDGNVEMSTSSNSGCGRVVCRSCSFENAQRFVEDTFLCSPRVLVFTSDTTTCFDCYGRDSWNHAYLTS
jgi:hypothetical protein